MISISISENQDDLLDFEAYMEIPNLESKEQKLTSAVMKMGKDYDDDKYEDAKKKIFGEFYEIVKGSKL